MNISNTGGGMLDILSVNLSEGERDVWFLDWQRDVRLAAGESLELGITFRPDDPGDVYGALVLVRTNARTDAAQTIQALGTSGLSEDDNDGDGVTIAAGDCNDDDPEIYPGAPERCNGGDDDCDGDVPAEESDNDGDGSRVCDGDCADDDGERYPGNPEVCDGIDNDCDNATGENTDADGDGATVCTGDCDDTSAAAAPGLTEVCDDNLDNDCDGLVDSLDADGDGHNVCGEAPDCDDAVATVFPRVVESGGDDAAAGSRAAPLGTLQAAVDSVAGCPIWLLPGSHSGFTTTSEVDIRGLGAATDIEITGNGGRAVDMGAGSLRGLRVTGGSADVGAGIRVQNGAVSLIDVEVTNNNATVDGGGVAVLNGELVVSGSSSFTDNDAATGGGAIHLNNSLLLDNGATVYTGNSAAGGGAIAANGSTVNVISSTFRDNSAGSIGGAIHISAGGGHLIQACRFITNDSGDGGAIAIEGTLAGQVRANRFQGNSADQGGGIWLQGATIAVTNNTFTANDATDGGAVRHLGGDANIRNNIAHFNGGNGAFHSDALTVDADYNTAFATSGADWVGPWLTDGPENRTENPGLLNFTDDGDHDNDVIAIQPTSPSVDSGDPDPAYNDSDGTRNDRGYTGGPGAN